MNFLLELIQFNILDKDFPGISAKWDLSQVKGLAPDPIELAAPAKTYQDMGYSASQIAKILNCPTMEPDKDFEKPKPEPVMKPTAINPAVGVGQDPKKPTKPTKPTKPGNPKPSDKPKPDNNNGFKKTLERKLKFYLENVSLENTFTIPQLWEDIVEDCIKQHHQPSKETLQVFKEFPQMLLNKPTRSMKLELEKNIDNIVVLIAEALYNVSKRP